MFAVAGTYVDGMIKINESVPVNKKYDVVVTFLKPAEQKEAGTGQETKLAALNRITGILSGNTMTLEEARAERLKRQ